MSDTPPWSLIEWHERQAGRTAALAMHAETAEVLAAQAAEIERLRAKLARVRDVMDTWGRAAADPGGVRGLVRAELDLRAALDGGAETGEDGEHG